VGSGLLSLVFGLWGWFALRESLNLNLADIVYRAIAALSLSVPYHTGAVWEYDWRIEIARWAGLVALVTGAGKAVFLLLGKHWQHSRARKRQGHWLVIGNDPFAERLSQAALLKGHTVHWLAAPEEYEESSDQRQLIDHLSWSLHRARQFGLDGAAGAVVAMNDDAMTNAVARQLSEYRLRESDLVILASMRSPWLAMRVDELKGASGFRVFSEAQMATRLLIRKHPVFVMAEAKGQSRLHTVIVDYSQFGEAVLIETLLSCLTVRLGKPLFTIVDPDALSVRNDIATRYPELHLSADIRFVQGRITGQSNVLEPDAISRICEEARVSIYYSCHDSDEVSLTTAIALQAASLKIEDVIAPIVVRQSSSRTLPDVPIGVSGIQPGQLIGFGALDDLAAETGLFSDHTDQLAKRFHQGYAAIAAEQEGAAKSWDELSEDHRESNRRLVVHIPAKLHCLGLNLEQWLSQVDRNPSHIVLPSMQGLSDNTELVEQLSILEHERWMADRRINGWTHGPVRNNTRRIHPDLVPFNKLSEKSKSLDREMVRSLLTVIEQR